jgi:hypothetical protein
MIVVNFKTNIKMVGSSFGPNPSQYDLTDDQVVFCRFCLNVLDNVLTSL